MKLKKSTTTNTRARRSNIFKAQVIVNKHNGMSNKDAVLAACEEHGEPVVDSFKTTAVASRVNGFEKSIEKILLNEGLTGEAADERDTIIQMLRDAGAIDESDDSSDDECESDDDQ